jgi:hypothetical protein
VVNCPAHAKHYRNDVEKVKLLLADERKTVATVQQIAFLLGENAAESEVILNSIIESYTAGKEDA